MSNHISQRLFPYQIEETSLSPTLYIRNYKLRNYKKKLSQWSQGLRRCF
jgi:hypothetical protein